MAGVQPLEPGVVGIGESKPKALADKSGLA
jgi:hypothetical protein